MSQTKPEIANEICSAIKFHYENIPRITLIKILNTVYESVKTPEELFKNDS